MGPVRDASAAATRLPDGGPGTPASPGRRYSGRASSERVDERRRRLIDSGIQIFGTTGYACAKVKELCLGAGLSERYFYESFEGREELLAEVYSTVVTRLFSAARLAVAAAGDDIPAGARAGMTSFVSFLLDDPRHAQIVLIEVVGVSPAMEAMRADVLATFADILLTDFLLDKEPAGEKPAAAAAGGGFAHLTAVALVGAANHVLVDALLGSGPRRKALIIEVCLELFEDSRVRLARQL